MAPDAVAPRNGLLAHIPQNIYGIAVPRKKAAFKSKIDDIVERCKMKMIQQGEERDADWEHYE